MPQLKFFPEPPLLFNYEQSMLDPRDGLTLFGPLEKAKPEGIRWGIIGTKDSITRMKRWVEAIQSPICNPDSSIARPFFPGFEAAFRTKWNPNPVLEITVSEKKLHEVAHASDRHQRVFRTVDVFASRLQNALKTEDVTPDIWCVMLPEYVYQNCRPNSSILSEKRVESELTLKPSEAKNLSEQPSLLDMDANALAEEYLYDVNFHHQLKARLLKHQITTQIIRETTIAHKDFLNALGRPTRSLDGLESAIAWTISTAVFYKAGGRPWKLGAGREGVCYIGLVFKKDERARNPRTACCAAQMFLDSGDGVVFKGAVGPWIKDKPGDYHLDKISAKKVVEMCINAYAAKNNGNPPRELFIHGRVAFDNKEWQGFQSAVGKETNIVGVRIRKAQNLKLFRLHDHPAVRGIGYVMTHKKGFLWTKGVVPRIRTYAGREVPNPLHIDICRGSADLEVVMQDILALTKLNYNACNYGDGLPVTLKFADAVGEILTAGPAKELDVPPLQFKYYI